MSKKAIVYRNPELMFETGSWTLHFWAEALKNETCTQQRRDELIIKLPLIQAGISRTTHKGKMSDIPHEMVRDELKVVRHQTASLIERIYHAPKKKMAVEILRNESFVYKTNNPALEGILKRPCWIPGESSDDHDIVLVEKIRRKDITPLGVDRALAGGLFQMKEKGVMKAVNKAREENRPWKTTEEQRYLVAMFILGAKANLDREFLYRILGVLKNSGYRALGLFHLSRFACRFAKPYKVEIDWNIVSRFCDSLGG